MEENKSYKRKDGKNAAKYEKTITYDKICPYCGEHFIARTWNKKTCDKVECKVRNTFEVKKTREERIKNGTYEGSFNREFECARCHTKFIKYTTCRKKYTYCDKCLPIIKKETYINNKTQKYGVASTNVGQGHLALYTNEFPKNSLIRTINNTNCCYLCGKLNIGKSAVKLEEHHLNNIHNLDIEYNKVLLCKSCHNRLHRIYNRLRQLGVIFPEEFYYKGKVYTDKVKK